MGERVILSPIEPNNTTVQRVRSLMERHGWGQQQAADYLGVPRGTVGNWLQGTRRPNPAIGRLLDVLGAVEAMAPAIHAGLMPEKLRR